MDYQRYNELRQQYFKGNDCSYVSKWMELNHVFSSEEKNETRKGDSSLNYDPTASCLRKMYEKV